MATTIVFLVLLVLLSCATSGARAFSSFIFIWVRGDARGATAFDHVRFDEGQWHVVFLHACPINWVCHAYTGQLVKKMSSPPPPPGPIVRADDVRSRRRRAATAEPGLRRAAERRPRQQFGRGRPCLRAPFRAAAGAKPRGAVPAAERRHGTLLAAGRRVAAVGIGPWAIRRSRAAGKRRRGRRPH